MARAVKEDLKADPYSGVIYVFRAKRADRIKLLYWDGSGLVLYAKRLEQGGFRWPQITDGVMRLSAVHLVAGMEWTRVMTPRRTRAPQEVS
ncbi:IS66 family insertion sequence element accessory protein TnpB [Phenylobacterium sp. J426]|uniref:IS66 family insertion sequence element accessory protein TnpB n=1 Tax=Phenylobacterium sp. J426 TaxID=2898439 RepID=UPI002151C3B9|nr:IS66 family insertion sequence element accessory protein TnpB [Phenylobacterium sp. J426]